MSDNIDHRHFGPSVTIKEIKDPDGRIVFRIFVYDSIETVCIQSVVHDLIYELEWRDWIAVSDLLLTRLQSHK